MLLAELQELEQRLVRPLLLRNVVVRLGDLDVQLQVLLLAVALVDDRLLDVLPLLGLQRLLLGERLLSGDS